MFAAFKRKRQEPTATIHAKGEYGYGVPTRYGYAKRELPGAGAQQYAFLTKQVPRYAPSGTGIYNRRSFKGVDSSPVMVAKHGVVLDDLSRGYQSGSFVTGPLLDLQSAATRGLYVPPINRALINDINPSDTA